MKTWLNVGQQNSFVSASITIRKDNKSLKVGTQTTNSKQQNNIQTLEQKIKLTAQERLIQKLKRIDREVRAHEQAHIIAGGRYVRGAANYQFVRGPDGHYYAIAGEVKIDTSPVPGDPEATLEKALAVKRAALAPSNPSVQDRMVAAQADRLATMARKEIQKKEMQKILAAYTKHKQDKSSSLNIIGTFA